MCVKKISIIFVKISFMRIFCLFILAVFISFTSKSQQRCSTDEYIDVLNNKYPQFKESRKKVNFQTKNYLNK